MAEEHDFSIPTMLCINSFAEEKCKQEIRDCFSFISTLSFLHIVNRLPEFHLDFPPGIYKLVLVLLWPGSSHTELHNVSALCFCWYINRLASCAPTVKSRIYVHSKQMSSL